MFIGQTTQLDYEVKSDVFQTPTEYGNMNEKSLRELAKYHDRMAKLCRKQASKKREFKNINKRANERFNDLRRIPALVLLELAKGAIDMNTAINTVAINKNVSFMCVKIWYDKHAIGNNKNFIKHRDKAIVQMVGLGLQYKEIAKRIGIHHNTITRSIKRELGVVLTAKDKKQIKKRCHKAPLF